MNKTYYKYLFVFLICISLYFILNKSNKIREGIKIGGVKIGGGGGVPNPIPNIPNPIPNIPNPIPNIPNIPNPIPIPIPNIPNPNSIPGAIGDALDDALDPIAEEVKKQINKYGKDLEDRIKNGFNNQLNDFNKGFNNQLNDFNNGFNNQLNDFSKFVKSDIVNKADKRITNQTHGIVKTIMQIKQQGKQTSNSLNSVKNKVSNINSDINKLGGNISDISKQTANSTAKISEISDVVSGIPNVFTQIGDIFMQLFNILKIYGTAIGAMPYCLFVVTPVRFIVSIIKYILSIVNLQDNFQDLLNSIGYKDFVWVCDFNVSEQTNKLAKDIKNIGK